MLRATARRRLARSSRLHAASAVFPSARASQCPRAYATTSASSWADGSRSRVSTVFTILIGIGVVSTAYGVYQFYTTFTMWPPEVRGDLRAGIKAKNQGDLELSERYLRRALATAQTLPLSVFAPEPYLKLSGIAIALAEVLEVANRPSAAYETYSAALAQLRAASTAPQGSGAGTAGLSPRERMRAVALAHQLGEMAEKYGRAPEEAEHFLTFAVEEVLRVLKDEAAAGGVQVSGKGKEKDMDGDGEAGAMLAELELPWWASKVDVSAPLEALGRFYAREDKPQYATTLYLQAIGLLMQPPPGQKDAAIVDRCRAAQVMNNLADVASRAPPPGGPRNAQAWARQARQVVEKTRALPGAGAAQEAEAMALCEQTLAAVLFNLGMLLEMDGKYDDARASFQESLEQAKRIGMRAGAMEARGALRRLERAHPNPSGGGEKAASA